MQYLTCNPQQCLVCVTSQPQRSSETCSGMQNEVYGRVCGLKGNHYYTVINTVHLALASRLLWHPTVAVRGWDWVFFSDLNKVIVCLWAFDLNRFSSFYDDDNTPKLASSTEASVYIILAPGDKCTGGVVNVILSQSVQLEVQYFELIYSICFVFF